MRTTKILTRTTRFFNFGCPRTTTFRSNFATLRPPLNTKLFPVHRPSGLKRADWKFYFMIFEKVFFFSIFSVHPSQ